jgi:hypothetical protein
VCLSLNTFLVARGNFWFAIRAFCSVFEKAMSQSCLTRCPGCRPSLVSRVQVNHIQITSSQIESESCRNNLLIFLHQACSFTRNVFIGPLLLECVPIYMYRWSDTISGLSVRLPVTVVVVSLSSHARAPSSLAELTGGHHCCWSGARVDAAAMEVSWRTSRRHI